MDNQSAAEKLDGLVENPILGRHMIRAIEYSRFPYTYQADWLRAHAGMESRGEAAHLAHEAGYDPRICALAHIFEQEAVGLLEDMFAAPAETRSEVIRTYQKLYDLAGEAKAYDAVVKHERAYR